MKNTFFQFNVPEGFIRVKDEHAQVRYDNLSDDFEVQAPFIECNLIKLETLNLQKGSGTLEKYVTWTEGYKTEVVSTSETSFNDFQAYRVNTKCDTEFNGTKLKFTFHNFCIILDDEWFVDIRVNFETKDVSKYQEVLDSIIASFTLQGSATEWAEAAEKDFDETMANVSQQDAALAEEPEVEIPGFEVPLDGKEYITIGDLGFTFVEDECKWNTVELSRKLYVQIQAKTGKVKEAEEQGLTRYGYNLEAGEVKLSFDCSEIYQEGIPSGEFIFKEGKTGAPQFIHFRTDGIDLDFDGKVTLKGGWIGIEGVFKKSYSPKPCFPVKVAKKLPSENIDWSFYQFNLEEALQIEPGVVQYLWIKSLDEPILPKGVLAFKNLKTLTLNSHVNASTGDLRALITIPDEINTLSKLEHLSISNTSVENLPETLGDLQNLERINLTHNKLTALPQRIFTLPKLKYLWVSHNEISSIPSEINLPSLESIDVGNNALETIPASLASQPNLKTLTLERNPWKSLPDEVNVVESIKLGIDDKRRLLDYAYKGADGKGMVAWDHTVYRASQDPELKQVLDKALKGTVLEKYQTGLEKLALKSVCLNTTEKDNYSNLGNSRFGGLPDLPEGVAYPTWRWQYENEMADYHHIFIAQLNCEELAEQQDYLPRSGMLYFFIEEEEGFTPKVIYSPNTESLVSAKKINSKDIQLNDCEEPYTPYKVTSQNFVGIPFFYSDDYWYAFAKAPELENLEDYSHPDHEAFTEDVRERLSKDLGKKGKFLEHNKIYLPDSHHSINGYVFTQHESPQEQAALKYKGNPEDWMVLLKVSSDNNCGFCFWDAGELFFLIHKSDLAKGDFSQVFASIETS